MKKEIEESINYAKEKVVCYECGSGQPKQHVESSPFPPQLMTCKYCGGKCLIAGVEFSNEEIVEDMAKDRGIDGTV